MKLKSSIENLQAAILKEHWLRRYLVSKNINSYLTSKNLLLIIALLLFTIAFFSYTAMTATNTVQDSKAGDSSASIGTYTITNHKLVPNSSNPNLISQVKFNFSPTTANSAKLRVGTSGNYYTCTLSSGMATCPINPNRSPSGLTALRVIITG